MPITYNEQSREFHLYNNKISYLIKIWFFVKKD